MKKFDYDQLILKKLKDDLASDEQDVLDRWLTSDPAHQAQYDHMCRFWEHSRSAPDLPEFDASAEWKRLKVRLDTLTPPGGREKARPVRRSAPRPRSRLLPALAVLTVLTAAIAILWLNRPSYLHLDTPNGKTARMTLSDNSFIQINSGSRLRYPKRFSETERNVYLQGEAFFHVAKGGVPFTVITENARAWVLGTQFNVWARKGKTRVVVKEGCVELRAIASNAPSSVLRQNEMSQIQGERAPDSTRHVDAEKALGWMEGRLTFESTPLEEVLEELERYHDVRIRLENRKLAVYPLTGEFQNMTIQKILESICLTMGTTLRKTGKEYVVE